MTPDECDVSHSCKMTEGPPQNLCNYTSGATTSFFDPTTCTYTFNSTDIMTFWNQNVTFEITSSSGNSSKVTEFDLSIVNPCFVAEFTIDDAIISKEISYDIFSGNEPIVIELDQSLVQVSPASTLCPDIELDVLCATQPELDQEVFNYDVESQTLTIDTKDVAKAGTYDLKVIARFAEQYTQIEELTFKVILNEYCVDSTVQNPGQSTELQSIEYLYEGTLDFKITPFEI